MPKYLIKIDYFCSIVKTGGKWFAIEAGKEPDKGVINSEPFASGPMEGHGCKRYYYSDNCDMDGSCNWQEILEVLPFSEEEMRRLNARESSLETKCKV